MLITNKEKLTQFNSCYRVWQGIPGIARTKKGRTFISFYIGETSETYGNYAVLLKSDTNTDFGELRTQYQFIYSQRRIIWF